MQAKQTAVRGFIGGVRPAYDDTLAFIFVYIITDSYFFSDLFIKDEKSKTSTPRLENDELKPDQESKESRESLRDRPSTKDSSKLKEREKSAKSDKGEKDKLLKSPDKSDKSRSGSKLSVVDKPERTKSGGLSPKSSRRMSRMEKPGDLIKSKCFLLLCLYVWFCFWLLLFSSFSPTTQFIFQVTYIRKLKTEDKYTCTFSSSYD